MNALDCISPATSRSTDWIETETGQRGKQEFRVVLTIRNCLLTRRVAVDRDAPATGDRPRPGAPRISPTPCTPIAGAERIAEVGPCAGRFPVARGGGGRCGADRGAIA